MKRCIVRCRVKIALKPYCLYVRKKKCRVALEKFLYTFIFLLFLYTTFTLTTLHFFYKLNKNLDIIGFIRSKV
nr:MAG TPA: hypothetical protein [Caudoviricetes sp.]